MAARRGKSQARRNGSSGRPAWVWLVAGLALGALVVLGAPVLLKQDGDGFVRFGPRADPDAQPPPVADPEAIAETAPAEPARPAAPPPPQYDFYTVLPGNEVRMSDAELAASAREEQARREREEARRARDALEGRAPDPVPLREPDPAMAGASTAMPAAGSDAGAPTPAPPAPAQAATGTGEARYILQAGAFGAPGDAEEVKAKIAMLGLSARVESGEAGGRTVYRVRMGPYGSASELAAAKQALAEGGLPAVAIRAQ
ncbi:MULTISPECIES: SPOR domain-containing protein [Pseudoxanthomonas]|uniref:Cell division protein FtsN n=1 Tax=Pseudoxanthomonas taiwanensis J19 TaxID=935569 RepID=A0A562CYD5_9GAMM|nr:MULTISPECIES: SPOR domain-containing protein [Pseudoxanthomonas]TWH02439.1 cell division protein FtsN [Pseudoxanthomonas taiwanensis J19]